MRGFTVSWLAGFVAITQTFAQNCKVNTLRTTPPKNANIALKSYSYCGGTLNASAYVNNTAYNKLVTLYYTDRQNDSTPLSVFSLNYVSGVDNSNFELWNAAGPIYIDGVTELLNLTFVDVDNAQTYFQILNIAVQASGAPAPSLSSPPAPYATPQGFSQDISKFLSVSASSEASIAFDRMFLNINPSADDAIQGVVVAARSGPSYPQKQPDYEYNWVRDASLTMDVVQQIYSAATSSSAKSAYEKLFFEYAAARAEEQNDPNLQTGLGEPKFYLNNSVFTGPWGRPQNDGPATAAITLIDFANAYLANGGSMQTVKQKIYGSAGSTKAPVLKDLLFVATNWSSPSYDLWEEEESKHFYTNMVQRRALLLGSSFATKMDDSATAKTLLAQAQALSSTMSEFWDPNRDILLYEYGPILHGKSSYLDTAVILGVIHGYANDGFYGYTSAKVLSTAVRIATSFIDIYPIANTTTDSAGNILGIPVGRYPEDVFNGTETQKNGGNPWYLCTAAFAQFMYTASSEYTSAGSVAVTSISKPFFDYFAPEAGLKSGQTYKAGSKQFTNTIASLNGWGDAFMRRVKYHTPANGHLHEEINRNTGVPQGAADLTWSYASVLTAANARAEVMGQKNYFKVLANRGYQAISR